jgi:hypothetical protein
LFSYFIFRFKFRPIFVIVFTTFVTMIVWTTPYHAYIYYYFSCSCSSLETNVFMSKVK